MPGLFFPLQWGAEVPSVASTPSVETPRPLWGAVTASAHAWATPSPTPREFHRVDAQVPQAVTEGINFIYRVDDVFPLRVKDQDPILVTSTITSL